VQTGANALRPSSADLLFVVGREGISGEDTTRRNIYLSTYTAKGFTLIERGVAVEANPVMASLLNYGVMPFTIVKFVVTAAALIILCLFKNVRITRIGLPIAINIYVLVVIYECYIYLA
jgi:FtsH-binding integral membrane protein